MQKWVTKAGLASLFSLLTSVVIAAHSSITPEDISSTAEPGVISKRQTEHLTSHHSLSSIQRKQTHATGSSQAASIKFKLTKIILEGNHVYSEKELSDIYKSKLNTSISVSELMGIVQAITIYYRNNGYILSQAILPPQRITKGVVHVRIIEGFIDEVKVIGDSLGAKSIIEEYGENIIQSRPLQIKTMDHYLRLMDNLPGVDIKAVLEPSKKVLGASTLNVISNVQTLSGYASYDNYGSLYNGPIEDTVSASANSIFLSGDSTRVTYLVTTRPKELVYKDIAYVIPVGSRGLKFTADANQSNTRPGLNLRESKINGLNNTYSGMFEYPLILSGATNLTINATFNYVDSGVVTDLVDETLYEDHIRSVQVGADFYHSDSFEGTNSINAFVEQGLGILGATNDPQSELTSRFGATGKYTHLNLQINRAQQLGTRFSAVILGRGQYSFNPLLSSEQIPFGGSQLGRGYDSADIIGDSGVGGSLELRMNVAPEWQFLQYLQPYIFYDGGVIWNRKKIVNIKTKESETSAGLGVRFALTQHVSGNFMIGQPLTKQDTTEAVRGDGRRPRGLFSVTMSV